MRRSIKITLALAGLPVITALGFILWAGITFKEQTVREGTAYGFSIGETSAQTYAAQQH